jgi:hypothetical protein
MEVSFSLADSISTFLPGAYPVQPQFVEPQFVEPQFVEPQFVELG